jgi:hypothetical protein
MMESIEQPCMAGTGFTDARQRGRSDSWWEAGDSQAEICGLAPCGGEAHRWNGCRRGLMCLAMDVVQSFEHVGVGQACRQDPDPGPQTVGGGTFGGRQGRAPLAGKLVQGL